MKRQLWAADWFRFSVTGAGMHHFLNRAAADGVRLQHIQWKKNGLTALASGPERYKLEAIVQAGGWDWKIEKRSGPGRWMETLLQTRPGLVVGGLIFLLLMRFLGSFVWCVDFGAMDAELQPSVRQLLAECGIHEGTRLTKPLLQAAQAQALRRSETFGWISLNFTGGCLSIESTPTRIQTVRDAPLLENLYAKADGVITAVELESGFAAVEAGQTVSAGQLLAAAEKLDRKGRIVQQGTNGRILAKIKKSYTVRQPLSTEAVIYTGRTSEQTVLYLPWCVYTQAPETVLEGTEQVVWEPIRLGRLPLPACICRTTTWEQRQETVPYTENAVTALALRGCRIQLLQEFPDAEIETEERKISTQTDNVTATVTYIFTANLAE